jgi:hypothetical protein
VLVAIDAAAERLLRIVHVEHREPLEADKPPELRERRRVAFRRANVVARCEQMARVEAYADAAVVVHLRDDRGELFERGAERRALAGGVLEQDHRPATSPRDQQLEERLRDQAQAVGFAAGGIAARVQHDAQQAEGFGAIDLVAHCRHRLPPQGGCAAGEIDEIAGVRHHWPDAGRRHPRPELADFLRRQQTAAPLAGILRKNLHCLAAVNDGPLHRPRQAAGDRHVGPRILACYFRSICVMFVT